MVDGARDAATAAVARTFRPATHLCDALDDTAETLVVDVPQTEGERVLPRQRGELIHE